MKDVKITWADGESLILSNLHPYSTWNDVAHEANKNRNPSPFCSNMNIIKLEVLG